MTLNFSAASQRNREPILGALYGELRSCRRVIEIGSGCGCHAITFGSAMPRLVWQTSELAAQIPLLRANVARAGVSNVVPPLALDARQPPPSGIRFDAVYSANTAHIMALDGVRGLFRLAAVILEPGGIFTCYGPFRREGGFTSASNAAFDRTLRARDPDSGLRDLEALDEFAASGSLERQRVHAMPSNNLLVVWKKVM